MKNLIIVIVTVLFLAGCSGTQRLSEYVDARHLHTSVVVEEVEEKQEVSSETNWELCLGVFCSDVRVSINLSEVCISVLSKEHCHPLKSEQEEVELEEVQEEED